MVTVPWPRVEGRRHFLGRKVGACSASSVGSCCGLVRGSGDDWEVLAGGFGLLPGWAQPAEPHCIERKLQGGGNLVAQGLHHGLYHTWLKYTTISNQGRTSLRGKMTQGLLLCKHPGFF